MDMSERYMDELGAACLKASRSRSKTWNVAFKEAIKKVGLEITTVMPEKNTALYPGGLPVMSPAQYGPDNGWPFNSFMVWSTDKIAKY
jgi:hypothetical protein